MHVYVYIYIHVCIRIKDKPKSSTAAQLEALDRRSFLLHTLFLNFIQNTYQIKSNLVFDFLFSYTAAPLEALDELSFFSHAFDHFSKSQPGISRELVAGLAVDKASTLQFLLNQVSNAPALLRNI